MLFRNEFCVPYKTLLDQIDRQDLIRSAKMDTHAIIKLLRNAENFLQSKILEELEGAPYVLIPVLKFYEKVVGTVAPISKVCVKRQRSDVMDPLPKKEEVTQQLKYTLLTIPGATDDIRMTHPFDNGQMMIEWIYRYVSDWKKHLLSDEEVGNWLRAMTGFCGGGELISKIIRLEEAATCRDVLVIYDVEIFAKYLGFVGVKSYDKLATMVAIRWDCIKKLQNSDLMNKQEMMSDISDSKLQFGKDEWKYISGHAMNGYCKVNGKALREHVRWLYGVIPEYILTCAKACMGIHVKHVKRVEHLKPVEQPKEMDVSSRPIQTLDVSSRPIQTPDDVATYWGVGLMVKGKVVLKSNSGLYISVIKSGSDKLRLLLNRLKSGNWSIFYSEVKGAKITQMLKSDVLPWDMYAADCFMKTGKVPSGLLVDTEGIYVASNSLIRFKFEWYRQMNGLLNMEQMFTDVYGILQNGLPKAMRKDSKVVNMLDMMHSFGFLEAMHKVIDTSVRDYIYPENVSPIFDLKFLPVTSQQHAYEIHRLTGRFGSHIIGYFNSKTLRYARLQDICPKRQRSRGLNYSQIREEVLEGNGKWITPLMRKHFSAKELCLLMVSVFSAPISSAHLEMVRITLGKNDIENMKTPPEIFSLREMHNMVCKHEELTQTQSPRSYVTHYMKMLMETQGSFIVLEKKGSSQKLTIEENITNALMMWDENVEWYTKTETDEPKDLYFIDLPPFGNSAHNFRQWITRQVYNMRHRFLPHVPCEVMLRHTNERARLIVFNYEKDIWHIWNGHRMGEYNRSEFDVIDDVRCLPAAVMLKTGGEGIALRQSGVDQIYWVSMNGSNVRLTLGKDFEWRVPIYYDPNVIAQQQEKACDRMPAMLDEVFTADSEFRYQSTFDAQLLPGPDCQDWAMREFFSKKSFASIWQFIRFFQIHVEIDTLYYVYFLEKAEIENWAERAKLHVETGCRWFWEKIGAQQIVYDNMVWQTKLVGRKYSDETYQFVMKELYGTVTVKK